MGARSADHQTVGGKQYIDKEVQVVGDVYVDGGNVVASNGATLSGAKRAVTTITDQEAAGTTGAATTLTEAESGNFVYVPALTTGAQGVKLPAAKVGLNYHFVVAGSTVGQNFYISSSTYNVTGSTGAPTSEKFIGVTSKGNGDNSESSSAYNAIGFAAAAPLGSQIEVTCISTTPSMAWSFTTVDGLAANTGSIYLDNNEFFAGCNGVCN